MSNIREELSKETIESFLEGQDPQKYIVAVEVGYSDPKATLIINDPEKGKYLEEAEFKPFLWFKDEVTELLYENKNKKLIDACTKFGIKITKLRISDNNGVAPDRMVNGYTNLATCKYSYNSLIRFFDEGGVDVFDTELKKLFVMFSPTEQFLIQSKKRLFKGMDDYNDLHRFQFDLETEGLFAKKNAIFQIGIRDNRGHEIVLETLGDDVYKRRDSEKQNIARFFKIIDILRPDIITGYNSENFDWPFLFERAEILNIPITKLAITLNNLSNIKRKPSTVKFGGETEHYNQTNMYGYNIIDISHSVRKAMAINSEIKGWGLKYITQYSDIAKPNRVYVPGDKINSTWADKINDYAFNDKNGDWYIITETKQLKEDYIIVKGDFIVKRYLCDDLWETEEIDRIFNQASFLLSKILPTSFQRSSTMGSAGQWKLIMAAWSYENGLAIPSTEPKRDFTGGLSRLLNVGYCRNVVKLDYAALYPKIELTHGIFPDLDISGVMKGILTYVVDTRDESKFIASDEKKIYEKLQERLKVETNLSEVEIDNIKKDIQKHKKLFNLYDKKQLPLKILANSWFGAYGAPYIFNWGETNAAEETTCRGRQYLRLMIRHFTEVYKFKASSIDTDGVDFAYPDNINDIKYIANGEHWKTTKNKGKELIGLDAVLAEFNEKFMKGRMGLDIDDVIKSSIKFSRKNYANDIGGKIKLTGNSIKSKKMPVYIEDFLSKGIRMLLDGDGHSFINYYYEYVDKIYNYQIPLVKIASKSKVKISISEYKKKANLKNKAGKPMPRQAHMELAIKNNIDINLGDTIYYINTGTSKSHGDIKSEKNKENDLITLILNCELIDQKTVESDFDLIKELDVLKKELLLIEDENSKEYIDINERIEELNNNLFTNEYNVSKYLDSFNKKIKPLLVCFHPDIRNKIILDIIKIKDKINKTTIEKLKERVVFVKSECELVSGMPLKDGDQDSYENDLMRMEDKEIRFWTSVGMIPNDLEDESKWPYIVADYNERMRILKEEGIKHEKEKLDDIFKHLEINDLKVISETKKLPLEVVNIAKTFNADLMLVSNKWGEPLYPVKDVFKYEKEAIERNNYYILNGYEKLEDRYQKYLEYLLELKFMTGNTINTVNIETNEVIKIEHDVEKIIEVTNKEISNIIPKTEAKKKKNKSSEDEVDDNTENEIEEFDDEIDDTIPEPPEDYISKLNSTNDIKINDELDEYKDKIIFKEQLEKANEILSSTPLPKIEEDDGWGF